MRIRVLALVAGLCSVVAAAPKHEPTKDQLKSGRKHMKAGWAAQPPPAFCPGKKPICDCLIATFPDEAATCAPF